MTVLKVPEKDIICVGVVSRSGPEPLDALLSSFQKMLIPFHVEVIYCIVENADLTIQDDCVAPFKRNVGEDHVFHFKEPRPGIAQAQNAILDFAIMTECDFVTFVDDRSIVDTCWLIQLYATMTQENLDLAGGPVRLKSVADPMTMTEKLVWTGLKSRLKKFERTALNLWLGKRDKQASLHSNNCMVRLDLVAENNICFDTSMGHVPEIDRAFSNAMRISGARLGWSPRAVTFKRVTRRQLGLGYQFRRGFDLAMSAEMLRSQKTDQRNDFVHWTQPFWRAGISLAAILALPFAPAEGLLACIRGLGASAGQLSGMLGIRGNHKDGMPCS